MKNRNRQQSPKPAPSPSTPADPIVARMLERSGMKPSTSRAVVEVTLSIETSAWGPNCTVAQAVAQATDDAKGRLARLLQGHHDIRINDVKFVRVLCEAEKA